MDEDQRMEVAKEYLVALGELDHARETLDASLTAYQKAVNDLRAAELRVTHLENKLNPRRTA